MAGTLDGAIKVAAKRVGVSTNEYARRRGLGERWCFGCKAWHEITAFGSDASRADGVARSCRAARRLSHKRSYIPKPCLRHGPLPAAARDGDVKQARRRVNVLVRTGRIARPNDLPCSDCSHVYRDGERRHEYDHYLGYAAEHHLDVEAVCTTCHIEREKSRGVVRAHG